MSDLPESAKEKLGEYLRLQREGRGISLERLSAITKIKIKNLEAIEEGRFADLPPEPILRGFLRSYAAEVGLDASEVLRRYEASPGRQLTEFTLPEWSDRMKTSPRRLRPAIVLGVWCFLAAGLTFLFMTEGWEKMMRATALLPGEALKARREASPPREVKGVAKGPVPEDQGNRSTWPPSEGGVALEKEAAQPAPVASREESASGVRDPSVGSTPRESEIRASGTRLEVSVKKEEGRGSPQEGAQLILRITAVEDTWLRVIVDDVEQDEVLLLEGRSRDWKGREKFVLTVGNTAGTRVELNGLAIHLPKTDSNVVRNLLISKKDLP